MRVLALILSLALASFGATAASVPPLGGELAAVPPKRLAERIAEAHAATDQALKARKAEVSRYQALVKERDQAAAAVDAEKRALAVGKGSNERLSRLLAVAHKSDERVQAAHALVLTVDRDVATRGAVLLRLYDALLVEKKRELERLSVNDTRRAPLVQTYQRFASQRDSVREVLRPALDALPEIGARPVSLDVRAGDDVESMLEKVDLARDLEARLSAQADALRRRIVELESEQGLARDVVGLARTGALFDEADRRLRVPASAVTGTGPVRVTVPSFALPTMAAGGGEERSASEPPPSSSDGNIVVAEPVTPTDPNAPPPPQDSSELPGQAETDDDFTSTPNVGGSRDTPTAALGVGGSSGTVNARSPTEQVFIGGRDGRTALDTLVATDGMSLEELRALEKKLRADAVRVGQQGKALRQSVDAELAGQKRK